MGVSTGVQGDVQFSTGGAYAQLDEATKWNFTAEVNTVEYASNKTGGVKKKLSGVKSASGKVEGVYNPNAPITAQIYEGLTPTLRLYFIAAHYIEVPAQIEKIEFDEDIDAGEVIGWSFDFNATAAWTYPSALGSVVAQAAGGELISREAWDKAAEDLGAESPEERELIRELTHRAARMMRENPGMVRFADQ